MLHITAGLSYALFSLRSWTKNPKIFELFHLVQQLPSPSIGGKICLLAVGPKCEQSKCPRCLGTWSFSCKNTLATFPKKVICSFCSCPRAVEVDDKKMETGVLNKSWCTEPLSAPQGCHVRSMSYTKQKQRCGETFLDLIHKESITAMFDGKSSGMPKSGMTCLFPALACFVPGLQLVSIALF